MCYNIYIYKPPSTTKWTRDDRSHSDPKLRPSWLPSLRVKTRKLFFAVKMEYELCMNRDSLLPRTSGQCADSQTGRPDPGGTPRGQGSPMRPQTQKWAPVCFRWQPQLECLVFILQAKGNVCPVCTKQAAVYHPFTPGCRDTRARLDRHHTITTRCHQFMLREGKVTCFTCPGPFPRLWGWCV